MPAGADLARVQLHRLRTGWLARQQPRRHRSLHGALTVPLTTQVANHLSRKGNFTENDLILVLGGNNDGFVQFQTFATAAAQIQADAAAGNITPTRPISCSSRPSRDAMAGMKTAALELANTVVTQILGKGGKYVVVMTILDPTNTPFGASLPAEVQPVLSGLSQNFNHGCATGSPASRFSSSTPSRCSPRCADPAKYGITNLTIPACDAAKISAITGGAITDGSSCSATARPVCPGTASETVPT